MPQEPLPEPNWFLSLLDTSHAGSYLLGILLIVLFLAHALCLGTFLLNLLVDASMTTAAERRRVIIRFVGWIVGLQFAMGIIILILIMRQGGA